MTTDLGDLAPVAAELAEALKPGILVGGLLGRGGMGAVFLGRDPALKRFVVIKVLAPAFAHDDLARRRFAREAESAAAVAHPNVVAIFLVGELPRSRTSFIVMQHVDGVSLDAAWPAGTKLAAARCRRIVGEVAAALAAAHERHLVHRDIKPANVMLERSSERAVVLDFGISAALTEERRSEGRLTGEGISLGTPEYMSPEQAAAEDVTGKSDVYSLGVLAFELLAGRLPFEEANPVALVAAHIKDPPPELRILRPDIDPMLAELVQRMLAKTPAARPTAAEVARTLLPAAHTIIEWPPPGLDRLHGQLTRALRWVLRALGAVLALSVAFRLAPTFEPFVAIVLPAIVGMVCAVGVTGAALAVSVASRRIASARQQGYSLGIALDTALDPWPDTADLVNGTGKFASLPPGGGWRLVRMRRYAALVTGVGVLVSSALLFAWAEGLARLEATWIPFLPVALSLLIAWWVRLPEQRLRRRLQVRDDLRWREPPVPKELVSGWLHATGRAAPRPWSRWRLGAVRELWEVPLGVAGLMLVAVVLVLVIGAMFRPRAVDSEAERSRLQHDLTDVIRRTGGFRVLDAALAGAGPKQIGSVDTVAARAMLASGPAAADPGTVWRALAEVPSALPESLRAALAAMAADTLLRAFDRVARSDPLPGVWYAPGALVQGSLESVSRRVDVVQRLAVRRAAAATLALARGDRTAAIDGGRAIVAVGRQLWRDPLASVARMGERVAGIGIQVLRGVAMASSDRRLLHEADSLISVVSARRSQADLLTLFRSAPAFVNASDSEVTALVGSHDLAPSDRWNVIAALAQASCWDPQEIRLGSTPARRAQLRAALGHVADIARSADWVSLQIELLDGLDQVRLHPEIGPFGTRWMGPVGRAIACNGGRLGG